jgi:hypothetical protein
VSNWQERTQIRRQQNLSVYLCILFQVYASVKRGIGSCLYVSAFIVIYKTTIPDHLLLGPWSGFGNLRPREGREKVGFFGEIEIREMFA